MTTAVQTPVTFAGRWGYHPCDYRTYAMLKRLAQHYRKAYAQYKTWLRWRAKAPYNRLLTRPRYDDQNRKCGADIVGVRKEPKLNLHLVTHLLEQMTVSRLLGHRVEICESVELTKLPILADYERARRPQVYEADVRPLSMTPHQIENLLARCDSWAKKQS